MQLNHYGKTFRWKGLINQRSFLVMKLTVLLLTVTCLQIRANTYAQYITLKETNVSLEKVFNAIYKQTGYQFVYTDNLLQQAKKISIDIENAPIDKVLDVCFKGQPFTYM